MMKTLVVYSSGYGSTKQYAEWIAQDLGAQAVPFAKADRRNLGEADRLVIGSSVRIGKLTISSWLNRNWEALKAKKVVFFSVSGTKPEDVKAIDEIYAKSMSDEMKAGMKRFALHGRMKFDTMSPFFRWMIKNVAKMEKDPAKREQMFAEFDDVKRESVVPVVAAAKAM